MRALSLFTGIGGMDLGFQQEGIEVSAMVEIDPLYRAILGRHWPAVPIHDDVTTYPLHWSASGCPTFDLVFGGFPCQPFSIAGAQKGTDDSRWLWPAFHDVIRATEPRYVVIENVPQLRHNDGGRVFRDILADLAGCGFDAIWSVVSAASLGFPHRRNRLLVVAYPHGLLGESRDFQPAEVWREIEHVQDVGQAAEGALASFYFDGREADGAAGGMAVAGGLTARMVEAGGNAVVPLVARGAARIVRRLDGLSTPL